MDMSTSLNPELALALKVAREAQEAVQFVLKELAQRAPLSAALMSTAAALTPAPLLALPATAAKPARKSGHERTAVMDPQAVADMVERARSAAASQPSNATPESAVLRAHRILAGLWMAYQPVVSAQGRKPVAYEALARTVASGVGGPIGAIQAMTEAGMLPDFGRLVRAHTAAALAAHREVTTLFVNIEESDLDDSTLGSASDPLTAHANRVVFDVSLSRFEGRVVRYRSRIERLQARGFRFALDDFGEAQVGLKALDELRPQFVKVGCQATENLGCDPRKQAVLATMLRACASRGTTVVAKAIERKGEFEAAAALGVPWLSGWQCGQAEPAPA